MLLQLYTRENADQIYERKFEPDWKRLIRRAGHETAHRAYCMGAVTGGHRVRVARSYDWHRNTKDLELAMLQHLHVEVISEAGEQIAEERVGATELVKDIAATTIRNMLGHSQVQPDDHIVYYVAGNPSQETAPEDTYRLPPAIDLNDHPEVARMIEEALRNQRCENCERPLCDERPAVFAASVKESIRSWHAENSHEGTEVGGVLLGYVVRNAPGGVGLVVVDHIPIQDPNATVVSWQIDAEAWGAVLQQVAERQAAGDPDLVIAGSWHSHDLKAITQVTGQEYDPADDTAQVLLPSANDLMLWELSFGFPQMVNGIFSAQTEELTLYRWHRAQPRDVLPLWVAELPASLGAVGKEAV